MSGLGDGFPRPNSGERARLDGRSSAGSCADNGVAERGKAAQPNVPEGSGILRMGTAQAGEQRQGVGHYGCVILGISRRCQNLF